ncbi:MAG: hypothetical protein QGI95_04930, partial [Dehalococcoidales bacterium]|nr:hypothetical protein [Dehalococcoidales bacterium]
RRIRTSHVNNTGTRRARAPLFNSGVRRAKIPGVLKLRKEECEEATLANHICREFWRKDKEG